jgi:hypothetical protein
MLLHVDEKLLTSWLSLLFAFRFDDTSEILKREFGVDTDISSLELDERVNRLTALKHVLEFEMFGGKHLRKEVLQHELTESATELRCLEDLLERSDFLADFEDLPVRFTHFRERPLHVGETPRRAVETFVEPLRAVSEPPVKRGIEPTDLSQYRRRELVEILIHTGIKVFHTFEEKPSILVRTASAVTKNKKYRHKKSGGYKRKKQDRR